ncbi:MAG: hypothetical protein GWN87_02125 [Desulfuromonadales bacterium]|nr:hypothetical protein [Desulfuromonadales bacterium]
MHIDAGRLFAVALPASWEKIDPRDGGSSAASSVTWRSQGQNEAGQPTAMFRAVSRPPAVAGGGFDHLEKKFFDERPGIEKISSATAQVSGYPARRIIGRFAGRQALVVFITSYKRAFTLEFTCQAEAFDAYRPLFEEILQSFQVL